MKECTVCILIGLFLLESAVIRNGQSVEKLSLLLGKEEAAVQSYEIALKAVPPTQDLEELKKALAHHRLAVIELNAEIAEREKGEAGNEEAQVETASFQSPDGQKNTQRSLSRKFPTAPSDSNLLISIEGRTGGKFAASAQKSS